MKWRDVASALRSATSAVAEPEGKWRIEGGADWDGDALTVVVAIDSGVLVVALF